MILDAGRGQCYSQFFVDSIPKSPPSLIDIDRIKDFNKEWNIVGHCAKYQKNNPPNAKLVAKSAYSKFKGKSVKKSALKPLYIRQPDAITLSS